ncbi:MAG: hypothetical protein GY754_03725 [bacterium]|nr:hypothetical protein [bacterium]
MTHEHYNKKRVPKFLRIIGMVMAGVAFAVCFALIFGLVLQYLWNWLMPGLFGLATITYWQAFGILILAKILFGSFGSGPKHHGRSGKHHKHHMPHPPWSCRKSPELPEKRREYYDRFWREEGEAAFEAYIERMGEEEVEK